MEPLTSEFWNERYSRDDTPWDIGYLSPPIRAFIDTLEDKSVRILIPGAGRAYEAVYLHKNGFSNVFVCDWAPASFGHLRKAAPGFPEEHMLVADFFTMQETYDVMLEQTFFCAIHPSRRPDYVRHSHELLKTGGILAGLLFASPFSRPGPPFGGKKEEYIELFSPYFVIEEMEVAQNSILPRLGNEYFFRMKAKESRVIEN